MNAFLLSAGFGSRMKEYTQSTPKPLLKVQNVRLLDYSLYLAQKWGIHKAILNAHYLKEQITQHLQSFHGFPIHISEEEQILGTGGGIFTGIHNQPEFQDQSFLLMNPDTILLPNSDSFHPFHNSIMPKHSLAHLYLKEVEPHQKYTSLFYKDGKVSFEKFADSLPCYYIGLSLIHPDCFQYLNPKPNQAFEMNEIWKKLDENNQLSGEIFPGSAYDVGEKDYYESLNRSSSRLFDPQLVESIHNMFKK